VERSAADGEGREEEGGDRKVEVDERARREGFGG
jgi:hypothetical protein